MTAEVEDQAIHYLSYEELKDPKIDAINTKALLEDLESK
jgi:hypothetical protein